MYIYMHERDTYMFTSLQPHFFPTVKENYIASFYCIFFYLFLPYNRCKFCWVHSRKWMSEVYKVGDTLLISFLLSTPFLRSISFHNRTRYYFANNSSLRFRRDGNIDLVFIVLIRCKKKCIRKIEVFSYFMYISIDRELHAHPADLHLLWEFYFTSARYKFANITNLRYLYKIEERYRCERTYRSSEWEKVETRFFCILPQGAMDRS